MSCSAVPICAIETSEQSASSPLDLPPGARAIALTQGFYAIVDEADFARLSRWRWRYKRRGDDRLGYAVRTTGPRGRQITYYMHRVVFGPAPFVVDHINGNSLDNRRSNLRAATVRENTANRRRARGATNPYRGVFLMGTRWVARIGRGDAKIRLGSFDNPEEAARAYDAAAFAEWGSFAKLNFGGGQ